MEKMGALCGSVRGVRGGSTVGGRARRGIGLDIGVIVWRVKWEVEEDMFRFYRSCCC
jgi:hypothetical protein